MQSPLSSYLGGKRRLAARIIARMAFHDVYCEPFCGSAAVFFRKPPSKHEILNDANGDVINFFRQVRDNLPAFLQRARYRLYSRGLFERYKAEGMEGLSDMERAFRYWYMLKCSFGGRMYNAKSRKKKREGPAKRQAYTPSFGYCRVKFKRPKLPCADAASWWERLQNVTLEEGSWQAVLARYDSSQAFFYLDPPYYGYESWYGDGFFGRAEYAEMAEMLRGIRGKFLLSMNDSPEVAKIFRGFHMEKIAVDYTLNVRSQHRKNGELLISNYETVPPVACSAKSSEPAENCDQKGRLREH